MSISDEGDIFITKPPENNEATIFRYAIIFFLEKTNKNKIFMRIFL